ncbi:MAG TPA: nitrate ABC transporter permease [Acidimicrobiaceae bacterium]|nr:nitrate ABC transporter permease [Acidimicrobiaceae bacterium]
MSEATDGITSAVAAVEANQRRRSGEAWWKVFLPPVVMFGAVIGVWYFVSYVMMDERRRGIALPPPHEIVDKALLVWHPKKGIRPILEAMLTTGRVALIGLLIAVVLGMTTAIVMNLSKSLERAIFPYAVVIQTLPILALVPIIQLWFGFALTSRVLVCVLIAIFPIITNTLFGLQSADRMHHDLFTLNRTSRFTRLWKMELPGAMPAIFTGLRIAAGGSVIGAIVGDFFFRKGEIGIGRLIDNYSKDLRVEEAFLAAGVSSLFGIIIFVFFGWLSNRALRNWHDSARGRT